MKICKVQVNIAIYIINLLIHFRYVARVLFFNVAKTSGRRSYLYCSN